jgi:hypothetical protein
VNLKGCGRRRSRRNLKFYIGISPVDIRKKHETCHDSRLFSWNLNPEPSDWRRETFNVAHLLYNSPVHTSWPLTSRTIFYINYINFYITKIKTLCDWQLVNFCVEARKCYLVLGHVLLLTIIKDKRIQFRKANKCSSNATPLC